MRREREGRREKRKGGRGEESGERGGKGYFMYFTVMADKCWGQLHMYAEYSRLSNGRRFVYHEEREMRDREMDDKLHTHTSPSGERKCTQCNFTQ